MSTTVGIDHADTLSIPYDGRPCHCERCGGTHHLRRDGADFVMACGGYVIVVAHAGFFLGRQSVLGDVTEDWPTN